MCEPHIGLPAFVSRSLKVFGAREQSYNTPSVLTDIALDLAKEELGQSCALSLQPSQSRLLAKIDQRSPAIHEWRGRRQSLVRGTGAYIADRVVAETAAREGTVISASTYRTQRYVARCPCWIPSSSSGAGRKRYLRRAALACDRVLRPAQSWSFPRRPRPGG